MLRAKKPLPEFLDPNLMNRLSEKVEELEKKLVDKARKDPRHDSARELFDSMLSDETLNYESKVKESLDFDNQEKWEDQRWKEHLGVMLYDYYRHNNLEDENIRGTHVFIEKARDILKDIHNTNIDKIYDYWELLMDWITIHEAPKEVVTKGKTVKLNNTKSRTFLRGEVDKNNPKTVQQLFSILVKHLENLLTSHLAFVPIEKKFETLNKMFNSIRSCNTLPGIKGAIVAYFYDIVYAISIISNWYTYEEAKKIIEIKT